MKGRHIEADLSNSKTINRHKLIQVDQKYAMMSRTTQNQVQIQLEDQLDYLLGRKEREALKKRKLQQMEQLYEQQRSSRLSKINLKISRSQMNRQYELSSRRAKSKKELDHFNTIRKKVEHDNEEQLQKMLEVQKSYTRQIDSRSSRTSINPHSSRIRKSHVRRADSDLRDSVEMRINNIENKIDHANSKSKLYFSRVAEKAKGYSHNFDEIMDKIRTQSVIDEQKCIKDYYKRAVHIQDAGHKSKIFFQKQSDKKKKEMQQKIKAARRNLRIIDRERQAKNRDIQIKLDRTFAPRTWKNDKSETYLRKFMSNQKELEQKKTIRAEQILKKHLDMTLRNKALRQNTEKIHQTVKKIES